MYIYLLHNVLAPLGLGIVAVGIFTYTTLYFYPLHTHRSVMIRRTGVVIRDIVRSTIDQNIKHKLTWVYLIKVINELDDDHSDITIDQLITEIESILIYRRLVTDHQRADALVLYRKVKGRLKRSLTKDPNLATITIPKRYIVRWIKLTLPE